MIKILTSDIDLSTALALLSFKRSKKFYQLFLSAGGGRGVGYG